MVLPSYSSRLILKAFLLGRWGSGGRIGEVLASAAKRKALCNLGHCAEQLRQPSPAGGPVPANSLAATPLNLSEAETGGWAGLGRTLGSGSWRIRGRLRWGLQQSCHQRPACWGLSGKGWCVGRNGDSDLMCSHYLRTFLCRLGEHTLFAFKRSVLLLDGRSFVGLCFLCVSASLASPFLRIWGDSVLSWCTPCQSEMFHVSGEASLRFVQRSFPDCRISGLFGSGADRFVLVWVFQITLQ